MFVARIIEGCNAVSIIILFTSFVLAFKQSVKATVLFIFAGSTLIYVTNLFRIVLISIGIYVYPEKSALLHDIVFPLLIYGMVFFLWMLWVRRLVVINKKGYA